MFAHLFMKMVGFAVTRLVFMPTSFLNSFSRGGRLHLKTQQNISYREMSCRHDFGAIHMTYFSPKNKIS